MTTFNQHFTSIRSNIRPDEALLTRIVSHIPEKNKQRVLLSPYVTYFLTTCVSMYALVVIALPLYHDYQVYRMENDDTLMTLDAEDARFMEEMDALDAQALALRSNDI